MDGRSSADLISVRPYRSKRHRPCDVCRRRKHACFIQDQPPCRVCQDLRADCTFNDPPTKRQRGNANRGPNGEASTITLDPGEVEDEAESNDVQEPGAEGEATISPTATFLRRNQAQTHRQDTPNFQAQSMGAGGDEPDIFHPPSRNDIWFAATMMEPDLGDVLPPIFSNPINDDATYLQEPFMRFSQRPFSSRNGNEQSSFYGGDYGNEAPSRILNSQNHALQAQPIRSLDALDGPLTAYYVGLSSEMDPFVMRHMRFPDEGSCRFGQFQYRRLATGFSGSGAEDSSIPVQFMISSPRPLANEAHIDEQDSMAELNRLVSPETGSRLVGLFLRYVFPSLPVLSRTLLQVADQTLTPKPRVLAAQPSYLLAAIYAAGYTYRRYEPSVTVSLADKTFPVSELWTFSYSGILRSMHIPRLATIQALLIYLQRVPTEVVSASSDSPGHWPLLGSTIHAANQIGLHIDCNSWLIPPWEKRLRRRLWWVIYSESTWRSMLLGLPQPIQQDEWDVSSLTDADFEIDHLQCPSEQTATLPASLQKPCVFCHTGHYFSHLVELSLIAHDVHRTFFTLAGTRALANDAVAALEAGAPLLSRIEAWHDNLPESMQVMGQSDGEERDYFHSGSAAHLKLTCLTLKTMVFRALLRPLAGTTANSPNDAQASQSVPPGTRINASNRRVSAARGWGVSPLHAGLPEPTDTFKDALELARTATAFARRLGSYDRNSFCYSWSRACFSTISSLIMLLLVLAPTTQSAKEVLTVLAKWVIVLREQCVVFDNMQLGLLRLDSLFRMGLEDAFQFSSHVRDCVRHELPSRQYQK